MPKASPSEIQEVITARVPKSVADEVRERLQDPLRRKVRYGALSELIEELLRGWLKEQKANDRAAAEQLPEHS